MLARCTDGTDMRQVYLSTDVIWDLGDRLLGRSDDPFRSLQPGQGYSANGKARLPVVLPGDYRFIVRADIIDDIPESNTTRSVNASTIRS